MLCIAHFLARNAEKSRVAVSLGDCKTTDPIGIGCFALQWLCFAVALIGFAYFCVATTELFASGFVI